MGTGTGTAGRLSELSAREPGAEASMLSGERILCFAPDPWGDIWRNRHRLLGVLARENRILYVEPRLALRPLARKLRSGEVKVRHFFRPRVEEARENLFVYHDPLHLPRTGLRGIGPAVDGARDAILRKALRRLRLSEPILWLVRPDCADVMGKFGEKLVLYQVVDDYASYPGVSERARARIERDERRIADRADLIVVTSERLLEMKRRIHPNVVHIRNGVDARTIEEAAAPRGAPPPGLAVARPPVFGYIGGITEKLDFVLLEALAARLRGPAGGTLVLVGPVNVSSGEAAESVGRLRAAPNVIFTGQKDAAEVPSYLRAFDVSLVPYKAGEQARAIDPLKLYEYLAFGKPIVSVEIPSVLEFEGLVRVARSRDEFLEHAAAAAEERDEALAARRRLAASEATWEKRAEALSAAIAAALERRRRR
jgi:glycosyltransferase involved in cell wall biosynthesis